ncbi:hypothetical protein AB0C52_29765 [Streptomyces sp. NPDC048717]|uniref:hypothetical protein n=1 Tax=Streptomyces sp. NPDC048717 TaxID=3154928 RepID=UPI003413A4DB
MYELTAVIADEAMLRRRAAGWEHAAVVTLREGLGLLPVPGELFMEMSGVRREPLEDDPSADFPFLHPLCPPLEALLTAWSEERPVAYVEAEFFGGNDHQSAAVWSGGARAWGPVFDDTFDGPRAGWPLNGALARLGVRSDGGAHDLFDAVGLGGERSTDGWLARAR